MKLSLRPVAAIIILSTLLLSPCRLTSKTTASDVNDASNNWWSNGGAAMQDGAFTAVSASLIGWGVGAVAAIAIVTALFGSESGSSSSHAH